jgi:hypothetical protein
VGSTFAEVTADARRDANDYGLVYVVLFSTRTGSFSYMTEATWEFLQDIGSATHYQVRQTINPR